MAENTTTTNEISRFQILTLDGGGIKGVFSAALLAAMEDDLGSPVINHFDLIGGTSTGGIIALALGLGMPPKKILEFYVENGQAIFSDRSHLRGILQWFRRKFPAQQLEDTLKGAFGERLFGESQKPLVIPSYNLGEDAVYIFRTPHHERLRRDYKVPAWKVGMATSAAPTFFPVFRGVDSVRLIDGGVWANNPTMVSIVEATSTLNVPLGAIKVFNIGTTDEVAKRPPRLDYGGIITWTRCKAALDTVMRGQSIAAFNQASHLIGKENIIRLSPPVASSDFSLDRVRRTQDLIGKASHHSRDFLPTFQREFGKHTAPPYKPYLIKEQKQNAAN